MNTLSQSRTLILAFILAAFGVGYTFAQNNRVVVIPLESDSAAPAGMVSAFNSETCPTGWAKFTDAQGRVVVGLRDAGTLGATMGIRYTDLEFKTHNHVWGNFFFDDKTWETRSSTGALLELIDWGDGVGNEGGGFYPLAYDDSSSSGFSILYTQKASHFPPYVQLLYCEKT